MRKALSFIYDGQSSEDYGVYIGEITSSNKKSSMASTNSKIIYDTVPNRTENFIYGVEKTSDTLEFEVNLFFEKYEDIDRDDIKYVDQWLFSNSYPAKLMFCEEDMSIYYFNAIFQKNDVLYINNTPYGFKCKIQCDSSYAYSSEFVETVVLNGGATSYIIKNMSSGLNYIYPKISFTCNKDNGSLHILNRNDNNRHFEICGLKQGESIIIDKWLQISSSYGLKRLQNCNKNWLRLKKGMNYIDFSGDVTRVNLEYQFIQGIGS